MSWAVEIVPWNSPFYWVVWGVVAFTRAMDFLSTWVATPNLLLEGNPVAKWLGWKRGLVLNAVLSLVCAFFPLPAVIISTTSLLVAARNFQSAWLMRTWGEEAYRDWFVARMLEVRPAVFLLCLAGNTGLTGLVGGALVYWSGWQVVPFGIGVGMLGYAAAVAFYSALAFWRTRRTFRYRHD